MTRKIAIIKTREFNTGYDGTYSTLKLIDSITDWTEVSDDDYEMLSSASHSMNFTVIEQPIDTEVFISKTVKDYKALVEKEKKRAAEEKAQREKAALERKFKKELKDQASKQRMLEKLTAELGVEIVKKI